MSLKDDEVPILVRLRLPDGREFDCHTTVKREYVDGQEFWWTEGNGGCDCNRSLYLNREHGLNLGEPDYEDAADRCLPCGATIRLVALYVDGALIQSAAEATK